MDCINEAFEEWREEFKDVLLFLSLDQSYELFESAYLRGIWDGNH